jgi:lipopolysaccharide/colanic/teichoic acid biosynthesis glycosyltransferase
LKKDPRVTWFGKLLRRTSLDELPQLFNVFRGEMSLIGPRPIVESEKEYYGDKYEMIASVKPGITGLWQVSGRSELDYEERVELDCYYLMNWNIWLDIFILLKTVKEVLFCKGAY